MLPLHLLEERTLPAASGAGKCIFLAHLVQQHLTRVGAAH